MIKVGDRVRATEGGREFFSKGDTGTVLELDGQMIYVQFDASSTVESDGMCYAKPEHLELIESEPSASQDWTPHDRYTAAALIGLLARQATMSGGFVKAARLIADEAMAARGGK